MISFIVPAYNEERYLGRTLESIGAAALALGQPWEVIVVNDGSTDGTERIAREAGATVVDVKLRHIAAVRNAGAAAARGDVLFFIDADTRINAEAVRQAWNAIGAGALGGGTTVAMDQAIPLGPRLGLGVWNTLSRVARWAAGCFIFVRREAFEAAGGFNESFYAAEEVAFSKAIKRQGKFVIVKTPVTTSARKLHTHSVWTVVRLAVGSILTRGRILQKREGLEFWYDGKRPVEDESVR